MSVRAILPGGLIAAMLTASAILALLIVLGIRGEGPLAIGLGDAGGAARLDGGGSATLGEPGGGPVETAPVVLPGGGVAAPSAGTAPGRRGTTARRVVTRDGAGQRRARTPSRRAPAVTPTAPTNTNTNTNTTSGTTRPTATSTPQPAVKVRDRGETSRPVAVKKQRVSSTPAATPAPVELRPVPAPTAPDLERHATPAPTPAATADGTIERVPPPS